MTQPKCRDPSGGGGPCDAPADASAAGRSGALPEAGSVPAWNWARMAANRRLMRRSRRQISLISTSWTGANGNHASATRVATSLNSPAMRLLKRSGGLRVAQSLMRGMKAWDREGVKEYFHAYRLLSHNRP